MPAANLTVTKSYRAMRVDLRGTVDQGDIADHGNQLHLLLDWNVAVGFALTIEPAETRTLKRTDGGKVARVEVCSYGKFCEPGDDFVTFGKDHGEGHLAAGIFGDDAGLHSGSPTSLCDRTRPGIIFQRRHVCGLSQAETACRKKATSGQSGADPLTP